MQATFRGMWGQTQREFDTLTEFAKELDVWLAAKRHSLYDQFRADGENRRQLMFFAAMVQTNYLWQVGRSGDGAKKYFFEAFCGFVFFDYESSKPTAEFTRVAGQPIVCKFMDSVPLDSAMRNLATVKQLQARDKLLIRFCDPTEEFKRQSGYVTDAKNNGVLTSLSLVQREGRKTSLYANGPGVLYSGDSITPYLIRARDARVSEKRAEEWQALPQLPQDYSSTAKSVEAANESNDHSEILAAVSAPSILAVFVLSANDRAAAVKAPTGIPVVVFDPIKSTFSQYQ